ncbi:DUF3237 domain-containing protein [Arthrobacter sp. ZGTC412]|uniref:DUF3237 domain-containing protein n=1 Tax=Arthrobacter sp. ZGTC412 TaxID=2058900 RepID=UPI000CE42FB1|nr:DUF3237 domain-containing protein [Arthrobacter sp. ZGTC412]
MIDPPTVPALERAFEVNVRLGPLADHGQTRAGHRRVIPITGGEISGGVQARILPGGADWQLVRGDGAIDIDSRYSARTPDGEMVYLQVTGLRTGPADVLDSLLKGENIAPARYYFRTVITIETSAARLRHLEDSIFIASCARDADAVRYTAYRIT